jgi:TolB-like protein
MNGRPPVGRRATGKCLVQVACVVSTLLLCAGTASPAPSREPTLAILDFADSGPSVELAVLRHALAEMLAGDLSQYEGLRVVERGRVDQFLREAHLGKGLTDPKTARRAGGELAADYVLTGSFSGVDQQVTVEILLRKVGVDEPVARWKRSVPADKLFELANKLATGVRSTLHLDKARRRSRPAPRPGPSPTLAVLAFRNLSPSAHLQAMEGGFADILQVNLGAFDDVRVVDREKLHAVLKEQQLTLAGLVDARTAARVGHLLGAQRLVYGSFVEVGQQLRLEVRLVDAATAAVVQAETAQGKTAKFADLFEDLAVRLARDLAVQPPADALDRTQAATPTRKLEGALHLGEAEEAFRSGRYADAAAAYERVLLLDPDSHYADLMRLKSWRFDHELNKAIEAGSQGLGKEFKRGALGIKKDISAWLAMTYYDVGKYEEHRALAKKTLAEFPHCDATTNLRDAVMKSFQVQRRWPEAAAFMEAELKREQATGDPGAYGEVLRHVHAFYFLSGPHGGDTKANAERARRLLELCLEEAVRHPSPGWDRWALGNALDSAVHLHWGDARGGEHSALGLADQDKLLRRLIATFPNNVAVKLRGSYMLAQVLAQERKWAEAMDAMQQVIDHWDAYMCGPSVENMPAPWDLYRRRNDSPLDALIEARFRRAQYLYAHLKQPRKAVAAYQALIREHGVAHHRGLLAAADLRALGADLTFPHKAVLVVGGGGTAYRAWRNVLRPLGFTVHSAGQYYLSAANLAPYRLVVLARQGSLALEPSQVLAYRSYVATGGSLLVIDSPGWDDGVPGVYNPLLAFFGARADHDHTLWAESTHVAAHPITKGVARVAAKTAVGLHVPAEAALIRAGRRTVLAALPYRAGRVVVASFGQWFIPDTDWMGPDWWRRRTAGERRTGQLSEEMCPVEHGDKLYQPLLRNVTAWLTAPRDDAPSGSGLPAAFRAAHLVSLQVQLRLRPREDLTGAMDKLVAAARGDPWREEALWAAGEAFNELQWFLLPNDTLYYQWFHPEGPPEPAPRYYQKLVASFPGSPLLPMARWRLAECARFRRLNAAIVDTDRSVPGRVPAPDAIPLYQAVNAPKGSYPWAWTQSRLGLLYVHAGDYGRALACFSAVADAMDQGPEKVMALSDAAYCCEHLKRVEEAKRYYRTILTLPDIWWVWWSNHGAWAPMSDPDKGYWVSPTRMTARYLLHRLEGNAPN